MEDTRQAWSGSKERYFIATDKGIAIAKQLAYASIPKLSRSKKRYDLYLHSEVDEGFMDWLKNPYWNQYRKRHGV